MSKKISFYNINKMAKVKVKVEVEVIIYVKIRVRESGNMSESQNM